VAVLRQALSQGLPPIDQAGPFSTSPCADQSWAPAGHPPRQAHEYQRNGTAKLLTLFHPATGAVRVQGGETCPNALLHG
jgi:hypothetical protein